MIGKQDILTYLSDNNNLFRNKYFVDKIGLIGSYARDDYKNDTDVDLVVYFLPEANNNRIFRLYIDLQAYISLSLKKKLTL